MKSAVNLINNNLIMSKTPIYFDIQVVNAFRINTER